MPSKPVPTTRSSKTDSPQRVSCSSHEPSTQVDANAFSQAAGMGHGEAILESGLVDETDRSAQSDESSAPSQSAVDALVADEATGDLERHLDAGVDSLDALSENHENTLASEDDFATLGVRNMEWRLPVIRAAAERSAKVIARSQLAKPCREHEEHLTQITLSTYRLIDPRYRASPFQQVRVGRLMPLLLQRAACVEFTPSAWMGRNGQAEPDTVFLFGHWIPTRLAVTTPAPARPSKASRRRRRRRSVARSGNPTPDRAEALEVLAELRARSFSATWHRWTHDTRFRSAVIALTVTSAFIVVILSFRQRGPVPTSSSTASQSPATLAPAPAAPASETLPTPPASKTGAQDSELKPEPTSLLTIDALMDAMTDSFDSSGSTIPLVEPLPSDMPSQLPKIEIKVPDAAETQSAEQENNQPDQSSMTEPAPESPTPPPATPPAEAAPNSPEDSSPGEPFDPKKVDQAAMQLWAETQSAARRFTIPTIEGLIVDWELLAELSDRNSLQYAAAKQLVTQASWLNHPLLDIVAMVRQSMAPVAISSEKFLDTDNSLSNTTDLSIEEVDQLLVSWRAARQRVVHAVDLNQMLLQSNVLMDRIVVSDSLTPQKRVDAIASFRNEIERLADISSDEEIIAESKKLLSSIKTLPNAQAWTRLESAEKPSGLLASIYCLQQRRWKVGIQYLGQSSNLPVAAAAKAEWELMASSPPGTEETTNERSEAPQPKTDWIALAERWSKIAKRLDAREAAAVRMHAIELYGPGEKHRDECESLRQQLPRYLR